MAQVTVTGTASRIFASKGFSVRETFAKRDGGTVTRYWNVFVKEGDPVLVAVDDTVKVTGLLSTEVSKRNPIYVDHKIGNATVEVTAESTPHTWGSTNTPVPQETGHPEDPGEPSWVTASIPE